MCEILVINYNNNMLENYILLLFLLTFFCFVN